MLRAIIRRNTKDNQSGQECEIFTTLDFECKELQEALRWGGWGPSGYDVSHLVGIEIAPKEGEHHAER